jgi:predicted lactoylglutathione lyase
MSLSVSTIILFILIISENFISFLLENKNYNIFEENKKIALENYNRKIFLKGLVYEKG